MDMRRKRRESIQEAERKDVKEVMIRDDQAEKREGEIKIKEVEKYPSIRKNAKVWAKVEVKPEERKESIIENIAKVQCAEKEGNIGGVTTEAEAIMTRATKVIIERRKEAKATKVGDQEEKNLLRKRKRKGTTKKRVRVRLKRPKKQIQNMNKRYKRSWKNKN